jgi:hypothetical protein
VDGGSGVSGTPALTQQEVDPDSQAVSQAMSQAPSPPEPRWPQTPPLIRVWRAIVWVIAALVLIAAGIAIVIALSSLQPVA